MHYPLTNFAVSLLAIAALIDLAARLLDRPQWNVAVDWLLFAGFAGAVARVDSDPLPVLKTPGLELTAGVARVLDAPEDVGLRGETKWWLAMRWRP